MQKFIAEPSFWEILPEASIGIMVVRAMKTADEVSSEDKAAIASILNEANATANQHLTSNTISENEVVAVWRRAYQLFKTKKGARCSIENLLKRVLKGNPVGSITPSVDIYNAISLKYALPVGGENIDAFVGDFHLGIDEEGGASRSFPLAKRKTPPPYQASFVTTTKKEPYVDASIGAMGSAPSSPTIPATQFSLLNASMARACPNCMPRSTSSPI